MQLLSIIGSSIATTLEVVEVKGASFESHKCDSFEILLVVLKNKIIISYNILSII